jgi:hypothetical protein
MTTNNFMAQLGASLVDHGFPILPIQPRTKKPGMYRNQAWHDYPQWSRHCERDTTDNEVSIWGDWPGAGIGRSGPANLNSTISGNSGYKAGSKAVWEQGVSNGEEEGIGTTHTPYP